MKKEDAQELRVENFNSLFHKRERDFLKAVSYVSFSVAVARLKKGQDIPL